MDKLTIVLVVVAIIAITSALGWLAIEHKKAISFESRIRREIRRERTNGYAVLYNDQFILRVQDDKSLAHYIPSG